MTAQRITDVTATRTRVDVEANYFTAAFTRCGLCSDIRSAKTGPSAQMGAVRQPNSPRRNHLNALGFLIKGVLSNLAHLARVSLVGSDNSDVARSFCGGGVFQ